MDYKVEQNMYLSNHIKIKFILNFLLLCMDTTIFFASMILSIVVIVSEPIVFAFFFSFLIPFGILSYLRIKKFTYIACAIYYSKVFSKCSRPFIEVKILTIDKPPIISNTSIENVLKKIEGAIKKGYLVNCTVEIQNGIPVIALAKKVVKDICPHCGAPLVDVVNNNHICKYCGKEISNVIKKK